MCVNDESLAHVGGRQPSSMVPTIGASILIGLSVYAIYNLVRLIRADADLALLSKGRHKADAFRGKVIWITGASQGLGEVLAKYLCSQGAKLILSSRSKEKLQKVKMACTGPHADQILILPFDLCGPYSDLEAAAHSADQAFEGAGIDYIIHNAGASQHALCSTTTAAVTDQMFQLNTLGPIKLTRALLPHMLSRGKGRVVVIDSMAAKVPSPGQAVYAACKSGLYGYFAGLATEVADQGVGVTICCPGPIGTGSEETPRVIYGAEGLISQHSADTKGRLSPARCAQLIANAMAHGVNECWIAKHPVLAIGYIMQYAPCLGWLIMKKVGPKRARAVSSGRSGYDVAGIMQSSGASSDARKHL
eukprot:jgi/Chrzof1/1716/Cz10g18120.t1